VVNAQTIEPIHLKQAIKIALDSNLSIRSSTYSIGVQKALKEATWDIPKTSIDGQFGQLNSYTNDNSLTISQSFAFPTVYINQNKLAKVQIKGSELQRKATQLEIATQVKQIYGQLAYLHSKYKLYIYKDSLFSGFLRAAELRAKTGETNRLEMITARSQSMEVRNQLKQVAADIVTYKEKLRTLLNSDSELSLADTVLTRYGVAPIVGDSQALAGNPSVGLAQQQVEVSYYEKKLEQSRMMPDFNIGYLTQTIQGVQDINGISRTFGSNDRFSGIQAGIAVPLWFGPSASKIKAAKLKEKVSQTNAEYYSKSLTSTYRSMLNEYTKYKNSLEYYENQALPETDMIIEQSIKSYKAGAMDYLDYAQNLNRALDIRQNYLDALNSYNQTLISIDYITGKIY
jgi:cobalt-zinc-cadmium resistance protein CzcA